MLPIASSCPASRRRHSARGSLMVATMLAAMAPAAEAQCVVGDPGDLAQTTIVAGQTITQAGTMTQTADTTAQTSGAVDGIFNASSVAGGLNAAAGDISGAANSMAATAQGAADSIAGEMNSVAGRINGTVNDVKNSIGTAFSATLSSIGLSGAGSTLSNIADVAEAGNNVVTAAINAICTVSSIPNNALGTITGAAGNAVPDFSTVNTIQSWLNSTLFAPRPASGSGAATVTAPVIQAIAARHDQAVCQAAQTGYSLAPTTRANATDALMAAGNGAQDLRGQLAALQVSLTVLQGELSTIRMLRTSQREIQGANALRSVPTVATAVSAN